MADLITISSDDSGRVWLAPELAKLTTDAAAEAYTDFSNSDKPEYTPPPLSYGDTSFNYIERFTGFDDVAWGKGKEERYGLIYQWSSAPDVYLFAFRGTASSYDMVLDLESGLTETFKPYENSGDFPSDVHVGEGFYKIYSTKNDDMSLAMQGQLFQMIKKLPIKPKQIIVTGHSLGCTLATLFALDVAVSLPEIELLNINYASPTVGKSKWFDLYNETYGLYNKTICVRNSYDLVPKVPPEEWPFDFKHIGMTFPVSFTVKHFHFDFADIVLSWHSLENYQFVVGKATANDPQEWEGEFTDFAHSGWEMKSSDPKLQASEMETAKKREDVEKLATAAGQQAECKA